MEYSWMTCDEIIESYHEKQNLFQEILIKQK